MPAHDHDYEKSVDYNAPRLFRHDLGDIMIIVIDRNNNNNAAAAAAAAAAATDDKLGYVDARRPRAASGEDHSRAGEF